MVPTLLMLDGLTIMGAVRRFRSIWLLVAFGLLVTTFAPEALASWQCEGRTCGTTLWFCCCKAPTTAQDANCATAQTQEEEGASAGCPAGCNCVLTVRSADEGRTPSTQAVAHTAPVAWIGIARTMHIALPKATYLSRVEGRGPPLLNVCFVTPVLRGPPVLTPNLSGSTFYRAAASV